MNKNVISQYIKENQISSPCYIFDIEQLLNRVSHIKGILGNKASLCYAIKANTFLVPYMDKVIEKYEVCSVGELEICHEKNINMNKVVFSGINKSDEEIGKALAYGVSVITIESENQFYSTTRQARAIGRCVNVLLRISNGAQFGMEETIIKEIVRTRDNYPYIHISGIQYFTGTQKKQNDKIIKEIEYINDFCNVLYEEYHFDVEEIEFGPGLYVPYFVGEQEDRLESLQGIINKFEELPIKRKIILELGRYLVANCGRYVTKVVDTKKNRDTKFCIVDGGKNHINYYGQNMAMRIPNITHIKSEKSNNADSEKWIICGSLCTFADVLVRGYLTDGLECGDYLVFDKVGAYSVTEGLSLFLSRELPSIYIYNNDTVDLIRDKITTYQINM